MKQLFIIVFLLLSTIGVSQQINGIIIADTKDPSIGGSCEIDMNKVLTSLTTIAKSIGYEPKLKIIDGSGCNMEMITAAIDNLKIANKNEDILVFYYSGHGFNKKEDTGAFPHLKLQNGSIALEAIQKKLNTKGAKLCLTVGDCCNSVLNLPDYREKGVKVIDKEIKRGKNYKNLFTEPTGNILISSCEKGQSSYSLPSQGAVFTNQFLEALNIAVNYSEKLTWYNLLEDVRNRMDRMVFPSGKQTPQYQIVHGQTNQNEEIAEKVEGGEEVQTEEKVSDSNRQSIPAAKKEEDCGISYANINKYLNDLIDVNIPSAERIDKMKKYQNLFAEKARVNIYDSKKTKIVLSEPISDFIEKLYLNGKKITMINLIENESKKNEDKTKYKTIAVQRIWEK